MMISQSNKLRKYSGRGLDCYIYGMDGALSESKDLSHIDTMYVLQRSEDIAETTTTNITTLVAPTAESLLTSWIDIFCSAFSVPDWKAEAQSVLSKNPDKVTLLLSWDGDTPAGCAVVPYQRTYRYLLPWNDS